MIRWIPLTLVATAALAACKSAGSTPQVVDVGEPSDAAKEARSLLEEAYNSLRHGDAVGMTPMLATDLFVAGPRPGDVALERSAAAVALGDALRDKKSHKLRSYGIAAHGSPDGHSAWATDQIDLDGQSYAVAALAAEVDGLWLLTAIEVTRTLPDGKVKKLAGDGGLAPAGDLPGYSGGKDKGAGNIGLPDKVMTAFKAALEEPDQRLDQLHDDAIFVGTGPRAVIRGRKALKKTWKKKPPTWTVKATLAGATPDGQLAWVLASAERDPKKDGDPPEARRLFAIYQRTVDEDGTQGGAPGEVFWDLVLLHEAAVAVK